MLLFDELINDEKMSNPSYIYFIKYLNNEWDEKVSFLYFFKSILIVSTTLKTFLALLK